MSFVIDPARFVHEIYRLAFDREPDPTGLLAWTNAIERSGDPTVVLAGLLESREFQSRRSGAPDSNLVADLLLALRGRQINIVDVGAQILAAEGHVYQPLCDIGIACRIIGFDPLAEKVAERLRLEGGPSLTLLPFAIGDGLDHLLYINNVDATSSLFPLNEELCCLFEHLELLKTIDTRLVRTITLDGALDPDLPNIDLLKLDIQGAELLALRAAPMSLAKTAVVHCEVEFSEIYKGQPLFGEVAEHMAERGFELIDLIIGHRYAYNSQNKQRSPDRLLWADAVFFRKTDDSGVLISQALIALLVYKKATLTKYLLSRSRGS